MKLLKTYFVRVLGCKVNQYDARQIERLLEHYGLTRAPKAASAEVIIVHTCGVTAAAARKSRQTIRGMQQASPDAVLIVTGCAAEIQLTPVATPPTARVAAGSNWLQHLAQQLDPLPLPTPGHASHIHTDAFAANHTNRHTRALLKVQDGCDIGCSYCIVPQLRKQPRDKTIQDAVAEAEDLTRLNCREIVVTGVSVGLYGRKSGTSLAALLKELVRIPDMGRIRLSSLHPDELTDELLEVWAASPTIMPHLHLSLQSGSGTILQAMRRGYTPEEYFNTVERARAALDRPAFTTDLIVGFPGETEACFQESWDFCRAVGFSRMHIFTYSPRPNTPAAQMKEQVNGAIATERSQRLHELNRELALAYHQPFSGTQVEVLVEGLRNHVATGYSRHYIPVRFPANKAQRGKISVVTVHQTDENELIGTE